MKKILRLLLVVTFGISALAMSVLAEDTTPRYYVKGIYEGAVIVAQQEGSREITVVDAENKDKVSVTASDVARVEFYKDDVRVATDVAVPYTYNLEFDSYGKHKFRAKVYDMNGNVHDELVYEYEVVNGTKNLTESFVEDFEGEFADTAALKKAIVANDGANCSGYVKVRQDTFKNSSALVLDVDGNGGTRPLQFRGATSTTGHKVHYYEFDIATGYSYSHFLYLRGAGYDVGANQEALFTSKSKIDGISYLFDNENTYRKVRIILDYNELPTASIYFDGKEYKRVSLTNVLTGGFEPALVMEVNPSGNLIYIDNFKYTVYDENMTEDNPDDDPLDDERAAVDITSITEGEMFAAGSTIRLAADASEIADVKNIDFYANGIKLPGTIVGEQGEIMWYNLTEGVYKITTMVTYADTSATAEGNEEVTIVVLPADSSKIVPLWPDGGSLDVYETDGTLECDYADEFMMFGTQSLKIVPHYNKTLTINLEGNNNLFDGNKGVLVVYAPEEIEGLAVVDCSQRGFEGEAEAKLVPEGISVRKGFNRFVINSNIDITEMPMCFKAEIVGAPDGNTQPIYIVGLYGMTDSFCEDNAGAITPKAIPEIPNGAIGICNGVGIYRINFDSPIYRDETKTPAIVKDENGNTVNGVTYTYGTDYIELHLPNLAYFSTYTVSIPENTILSYYSAQSRDAETDKNTYVEATDFTFTTKKNVCGSAIPVIKMNYPEPGTVCFADTSFAAKIVASNSTIKSVKFYKGDAELGEGVKMSDNEYWFEPDTDILTAGEDNVITVEMFNENGDQLGAAATATYTAFAKPEYDVKGIYDNAVIVGQEEASRRITVVDKANKILLLDTATNVSKVEFYKDNVLVATDDDAPYIYELVFDNYGTHKLQAKVWDVYNTVYDDLVYEYMVVNGIENAAESFTEDFEGIFADEAALKKAIVGNDGKNSAYLSLKTTTFNGSQALELNRNTTKSASVQLRGAASTTGHKVHYYEFDISVNDATRHGFYIRGNGYTSGDNQETLFDTLYSTEDGAKKLFNTVNAYKNVRVILDYNESPTALLYIDGKEYKNISLKDKVLKGDKDPVLEIEVGINKDGVVYIDNFKYTVYDVDNTVNFGTAVYEREYAVADGNVTITTGATNTSGDAGSLINIIAVYDGNDRLIAVKEFDAVDYADGDFKTQTYNVAVTEEGAAKVRVFSLNNNGTIAPVGLYK